MYPSDLNETEWQIVKDHFSTGNYGKFRKHSKHDLVNAVLYLVTTGCKWRFLPQEYPYWKTVYSFYRRAQEKGIWEKMMKDLAEKGFVLEKNPKKLFR